MRLGQLARQLSVSTEKIVTFLATRDISVDNSNNARIDDSYVDLVLQHFAPGNEAVTPHVTLIPDATVASDPEPTAEILPEANSEGNPEAIEVIKAPKIELPGLRVIGKIELPEKKKPELEKEKEQTNESVPPPTSRRPQKQYPIRERKNPVTLARQREEEEKKRKLEMQREQEKQRKKEFYEKRLKPQAPTKPARLVREEYEEMAPLEPERPKSAWGRFMRWLTT